MSERVIGRLDRLAHFLHRIHLIPERLLNHLCDRYDRALGVTESEMYRT